MKTTTIDNTPVRKIIKTTFVFPLFVIYLSTFHACCGILTEKIVYFTQYLHHRFKKDQFNRDKVFFLLLIIGIR